MSLWLTSLAILPVIGADEDQQSSEQAAPLAARLVVVPLPLTGSGDDQAIAQLQAAVSRLPRQGNARPLLILEFAAQDGTAGEGTEFESALKLARVLTSDKLSGVRTVAYLPRSVKGHGVLPVIACDEIAMSPDAEFGGAGVDENEIGAELLASYQEIARRRRTVPESLALGMLDRRLKLRVLKTPEGTRVIEERELPEVEKTTTIIKNDPLKAEGDHGIFSAATWRYELQKVSHLVGDHQQLAEALKISPHALEENPLAGQQVSAVRIELFGPVNPGVITPVRSILHDVVRKQEVNLIILWIRSEGGSLTDGLKIAQDLSAIDRTSTRTVAYVSDQARGPAAIIALACDELVMEEGAVLGGQGIHGANTDELNAAIPEVREMFLPRGKSWSAALTLAGLEQPLRRASNVQTGERRLLSDAELSELKNPQDWTKNVDAIDVSSDGITTDQAVELGLAQHRSQRFDEVKSLYHIEGEIGDGEINWALTLVKHLADPRLSGLLLFIGTFALFSELSQPGLGVPGFVAAVCFLLFFWAKVLHGTADTLELVLFVAGAGCVFIEIFVAPGTMVFGIGGALMIVASIVLASQTFILPTNTYELRQLPSSLLMVAGAAVGGIVGIVVLQRFLPHTPYLKRLILQPPVQNDEERDHYGHQFASFDYLVGKRGVALTPLVPAGKAQFGDEVVAVISDGPLVEVGSSVTVIETVGSRIKVRPLDT